MANVENEADDTGPLSRHPLRTVGVALMAGAALGASLSKARRDRRSSLQKIRDQLNDAL